MSNNKGLPVKYSNGKLIQHKNGFAMQLDLTMIGDIVKSNPEMIGSFKDKDGRTHKTINLAGWEKDAQYQNNAHQTHSIMAYPPYKPEAQQEKKPEPAPQASNVQNPEQFHDSNDDLPW